MAVPIAVFAFNRPDHLKRSLDALARNDLASESALTVFCDGPRNAEEKKKTDAVRALCRSISGFKDVTLVERDENRGCGRSIASGLQEFFGVYPEGIVVEDDIVFAPNALRWFNACLARYRDEPAVFSVSGWSFPEKHMPFPADYPCDAYFLPRFLCWGWASWADRVKRIDWALTDYEAFIELPALVKAFSSGGADLPKLLKAQRMGEMNTWAVQAAFATFKHGQVSLAPRFPYTTNIGTSGEGTHVGPDPNVHPTHAIDLSLALDAPRLPAYVVADERILKSFRKVLGTFSLPLGQRLAHGVKRILGGK
ncbi:MAG: glycosyltransferase [Candidatus Accumulibacter sp.]|jgi:hypothetical protein|nr:glycosyltransferase [Accumulibacter sp.]